MKLKVYIYENVTSIINNGLLKGHLWKDLIAQNQSLVTSSNLLPYSLNSYIGKGGTLHMKWLLNTLLI